MGVIEAAIGVIQLIDKASAPIKIMIRSKAVLKNLIFITKIFNACILPIYSQS